MAAPCFIAWNAAMPTTVPVAAVTVTSTTTKTLLQIVPATNQKMRIIEWGYTLDTAPANNIRMELIETGAVYATSLTAHVAAGIMPYNDSGAVSLVQLGTALSGYTGTPGTPTSTRLFDYHYENGLYTQRMWPLSREPEVRAGDSVQIRATTGASAANITCYIVWEE